MRESSDKYDGEKYRNEVALSVRAAVIALILIIGIVMIFINTNIPIFTNTSSRKSKVFRKRG